MFGGPDLVLDDHRPPLRLVEYEDVYPAIARIDLRLNRRFSQAPIMISYLGQRVPIGGFRTLPQEASQEVVAQAMVLPGIEEESQEAGVHNFLTDEAYGFEDVEAVEQLLYSFQFRCIGLQCL
jgi:hypothetical protein